MKPGRETLENSLEGHGYSERRMATRIPQHIGLAVHTAMPRLGRMSAGLLQRRRRLVPSPRAYRRMLFPLNQPPRVGCNPNKSYSVSQTRPTVSSLRFASSSELVDSEECQRLPSPWISATGAGFHPHLSEFTCTFTSHWRHLRADWTRSRQFFDELPSFLHACQHSLEMGTAAPCLFLDDWLHQCVMATEWSRQSMSDSQWTVRSP